MTAGQRWRFRRDLVIAVAYRAGLSQRLLADVFDMSRSRVKAILVKWDQILENRQGGGLPELRGVRIFGTGGVRRSGRGVSRR